MKILAVSDIHGNLAALRKVRAREHNAFDVVIVPGDIGDHAGEIFDILSTFECPVLYIYGNWDHRLSFAQSFGLRCHHLHLKPFELLGFTFVGLSDGSEIAAGAVDWAEAAGRYRRALADVLQSVGAEPQRTIVVTHDRLTRLQDVAPRLLLHVFGHIHKFRDTTQKGTRFVNAAALNRPVSVVPETTRKGIRNINDGNYAIIEISEDREIDVRCVPLSPSFDGWLRLPITYLGDVPWVPGEG